MDWMNKKRKLNIYLIIIGVLFLLAVIVPVLSPYPYDAQEITRQNLGISAEHWFGTDKFGRDIFTRICYGMRISLLVGLLSSVCCFVIGVVVGAAAGWGHPAADMVILEAMNIISAVPSMLYVILILLVFDAGVWSVIAGISVSGWIELAKMVRIETRRIRQMDYCVAARMMGLSFWRILCRYILPNEKELLIVQTVLLIPRAIFTEAFLSFLGIGIAAPEASLGTMIQDARGLIWQYPSQMLYPVLVLAGLILCLQNIGCVIEDEN